MTSPERVTQTNSKSDVARDLDAFDHRRGGSGQLQGLGVEWNHHDRPFQAGEHELARGQGIRVDARRQHRALARGEVHHLDPPRGSVYGEDGALGARKHAEEGVVTIAFRITVRHLLDRPAARRYTTDRKTAEVASSRRSRPDPT